MSTVRFDDELSRKVEAIYTTPDVVAQRNRVLDALRLTSGEHVLDIGSGPGLLAGEMAQAVGRSGRICGMDASNSMVAMAGKRCAEQPWVEFRVGDATQLPYSNDSFTAVVCTQVLEYVPDVPAALAEIHRVVRPGGRAVILDTDAASLVIHTEDETRMTRVLSAWNDHFAHPHLPRTLSQQLRAAGFSIRDRQAIPMFNPEFEDNTYGKGMLGIMASFVVGRKGVTQSEADAWYAEFATLGKAGKFFFSLNRYLFVADKRIAG